MGRHSKPTDILVESSSQNDQVYNQKIQISDNRFSGKLCLPMKDQLLISPQVLNRIPPTKPQPGQTVRVGLTDQEHQSISNLSTGGFTVSCERPLLVLLSRRPLWRTADSRLTLEESSHRSSLTTQHWWLAFLPHGLQQFTKSGAKAPFPDAVNSVQGVALILKPA